MKTIALIGSTGSIGRQVLSVVRRHSDKYKIESLVANSSKELFLQQVKEFRPKFAALVDERTVVLAADTLVALGDTALGKPQDEADARTMLRSLSGRAHEVYTGVALMLGGRLVADADATSVRFRELTDREIADYVATGEPMDKAGAYGIQGLGGALVASTEGAFDNVVGLPCRLVDELLARLLAERGLL